MDLLTGHGRPRVDPSPHPAVLWGSGALALLGFLNGRRVFRELGHLRGMLGKDWWAA